MGARDNTRTMVATELLGPDWAACERFVERATRALEVLSFERAAHESAPVRGFRLAWQEADEATVDPSELSFVTLSEGEHLVVGRHSACDVRLSHPGIALRHILLRARCGPDGGPSLVGTDLGAELPFWVGPGGTPTRSFEAAGPTVLRLANTVLVALPLAGALVPDESGRRAAVVDADPEQARGIPRAFDELAARTLFGAITRTQILSIEAPLPVEILPRGAGAPFARIAMRGPSGRVVVELSRAQLERVVLVGRYPRCRFGELAPFSVHVSRVHAALALDGDDVVVLDLASTNGIGTPPARAIRVRTRGSVSLGPGDRLDVDIER